jgi:POT family proton-dependent oligopeptide transporter
VGLFVFDTAYFQSLNPAMVVGFAPLFAILWTFLGRSGKEPNTPVKMALGIVLAGIGFLFMYGAAAQVEGAAEGSVVLASFWWVAITYVFHTFGELCLSPVGLSMITKLSPARYSSLMMGVWFLSVFLANVIAGYLVGVKDAMGGYTNFFLMLAIVIISLGIILFAISGKLRKMMHGVG